MFIRIRNRAEEVDRLYLEKLGLSTSRDNDDAIGQFGSGSKYAPIFALRNGWRWISCGQDSRGPYQMEYVSKDVYGVDSIFFDYGNGDMKESSYTTHAGVLTWEQPFQIFREAFANCLDGGYDSDIAISLVDDIEWEPGFFDVYMTAADELVEIVSNMDRYFSVDRVPVWENFDGTIKVYEPLEFGETRIYSKGVLVGTYDESSTFDYEFSKLELNEERTIKNEYDLHTAIQNIFNVSSYEIARRYVDDMLLERFEFSGPSYQYYSGCQALKEAFTDKFGEKAIPITQDGISIKPTLDFKGYLGVVVNNSNIVKTLNNSDIKSIKDALGDGWEFNILDDYSDHWRQNLGKAREILEARGRDLVDFEVFSPTPMQESTLGIALMNENRALISTRSLESVSDALATMLHEQDHLDTDLHDDDPGFRHHADKQIAAMMIADHKVELGIQYIETPGVGFDMFKIIIPSAEINELSWGIHDCGDFSMLVVGGRRFMINQSHVGSAGNVEVEDGKHFSISLHHQGNPITIREVG